ncbi:MAG: hypothetical protein QG602_919 [Verrucomicrobiota bacterium]|nr:hypothetical protein [Verrucomicrobiota bacterium]
MKIPRVLAVLFLLPVALLAGDPTFDTWVDDFSAEWMRADPMAATEAQYFSGAEQDALDRRLTPYSAAARAAQVACARAGLKRIAGFDRRQLDAIQRVSADMLAWQLDTVVRRDAFTDQVFVFNQFDGVQRELVDGLSQTHPIRNRRDIENYLARLGQVAGYMDGARAQAQDRGARGFLPPKFILTATLAQFDRFLEGGAEKNILVTSLDERAGLLKELPAADRAAFVATATGIVRDAVLPAFAQVHALLNSQLATATEDAGLWRLPGGREAYVTALRHYTTTDLSPEKIHEIGLAEVARIEAKMEGLFVSLGYKEGSIKERYDRLNQDLQPPADPDPRPALLARHEEILADAVQRSESLFDLRPAAPCVVRRIPPFSESNSANHYTTPAKDGTRPGTFWANLAGPVYRIPYMRTLTYHEGIPGHHFQIALQQEQAELPRFRRDRIFGFISAHGEGWALYSEQLAAENNWYEGDPVGLIGQLEAELFRARRLVVDTGLHTMKWTRQQAIDYGILPREVDRYVAAPGQACSYKIGMIRILELREKARQALGDRFVLKEFHNAVLRAGTVPLAVLETVIDDHIAARQGRHVARY